MENDADAAALAEAAWVRAAAARVSSA